MNILPPYDQKTSSLFVRITTTEPLQFTPYVVKGAIMKYFPNERFVIFINGELHGHFLYPRIQVKILREQLCIFAMNEGCGPTASLVDAMESIQIEDKTFTVEDIYKLEQEDDLFTVSSDSFYKYKFITPWVALNEKQLHQYEPLFSNERRALLNTLLERNLEFVANDLGVQNDEPIQVRFVSSSLTPKTIEYSKFGSFKGFFTSNIRLPDYLGLGNNISKGLGTLVKMKDMLPDQETKEDSTS